jgi:hypothetical protein
MNFLTNDEMKFVREFLERKNTTIGLYIIQSKKVIEILCIALENIEHQFEHQASQTERLASSLTKPVKKTARRKKKS